MINTTDKAREALTFLAAQPGPVDSVEFAYGMEYYRNIYGGGRAYTAQLRMMGASFLARLQKQGLVSGFRRTGFPYGRGGKMYWRITDAGRAALAENN